MSAEETLAQIAAEVSSCASCVLRKTRRKSVPGEGPANCEIMFIGEGPGQTENEQGRPFVGAAGQFLDQLLAQAKLKRPEVWIGNVVKCFISPRVKIYTSEGYKSIKDIQIGDLVLTHTGKFRPVTYIRPREILPTGSDVIEIIIRRSDGQHSRPVRLTVTPEHPFLVNGHWTPAAEIRSGDAVQVLGDRCEECGRPFYAHYRRYDNRATSTCSPICHNRRVLHNPATREKIRNIMNQQYAEGLRDPIAITARANAKTRELVALGEAKAQHFSTEERRLGRIALAQNITQGYGKHPIGYGELELLEILDRMGVEYVHHFALPDSPYTFDVCLPYPKILIEVRGPGFRNKDMQARALIKDNEAQKYGYLVVNLWWEQIIHQPEMVQRILERLLKNHRAEYIFTEARVEKATRRQTRRNFPLYNIGVEGDESYIADGVVNHNCRPPDNRDPMPEELSACNVYLERQINAINPSIIVTLGRFSMGKFMPGAKISAVHGQMRKVGERFVIAMFHPAAALHQPQLKTTILADFAKLPQLLEVARRELAKSAPVAEKVEEPKEEPKQLSLF